MPLEATTYLDRLRASGTERRYQLRVNRDNGMLVPVYRNVKRVQTGIRIEKQTLQVLKGLAAYLDIGLGNLIEGIVLHSFEGKAPFSPQTLAQIKKLRSVYGHTLAAADSHNLRESEDEDE